MHQTMHHSEEVRHAGADVENNVTVAYTSDKGLCGGINSTVTKYTRGVLRSTEGGETSCVGVYASCRCTNTSDKQLLADDTMCCKTCFHK